MDNDYADHYQRAVKFNADEHPRTSDNLQQLLAQLSYSDRDLRGDKDADHTLRNVTADALQDHGRDLEAALLRDRQQVKISGMEYKGKEKWLGGRVEPDYPEFAWPGGYPVVYHHEHGGISLCGECMANHALARAKDIAAGEEPDDSHEKGFFADTHDEGPPLYCDNCNKQIDSSYGDPGEDRE